LQESFADVPQGRLDGYLDRPQRDEGMIGNDFVPYLIKYARACGECDCKMPKGFTAMASIKDGKVKKIVCSETCRQEFDYRVWQAIAVKNARRRMMA
jgi:hypothetical protein